MKAIGGYFEWEFLSQNEYQFFDNAVALNSAQHALEYILRGLSGITRLYIPYFTCEDVFLPPKQLHIPYVLYRVDKNFEIDEDIQLGAHEYLIYTNYFGIKDSYVRRLVEQYGSHLIIDNAQAFFAKPYYSCHQVYSPRKFFGVPDGGFAITTVPDYSDMLPDDKSYSRCSFLLKRIEEEPMVGYDDFRRSAIDIINSPLSRMSKITRKILSSVDMDGVKAKRRDNFQYLYDNLKKKNLLSVPDVTDTECPMVYPFYSGDDSLKQYLISKNVFVATYWPNVIKDNFDYDVEYQHAKRNVYLPIDQRYSIEDMRYILNLIEEYKN